MEEPATACVAQHGSSRRRIRKNRAHRTRSELIAEDYDREVDAFVAGPLAKARVDEKLDAWTKQLEPFVMEAFGGPGAPSVDEWKYGVNELRKKIESQREHEGFAY